MIRWVTLLLLLASVAEAGAETKACAHRGDSKVAPENTLPAIESAVQKGAAMIEFDVQRTMDGHLVLMHDNRIDRTTDGKGKVEDFTLAELRKLDAGAWFSEKYAGTPIPTLEEALALIPGNILCNVHLKSGAGIAAATALKLKELQRLDHCFLAALPEQIPEAREAVPGIKICHMGQRLDRAAYIEAAIAADADYVQLIHASGTEGLAEDVKRLHEAGITVNWFSAQEKQLIQTLAAAGVDYILTDDLDLCQQVLRDAAPASTATEYSPVSPAFRREVKLEVNADGSTSYTPDTTAPWAFRHKMLTGVACPCPQHLAGAQNPLSTLSP